MKLVMLRVALHKNTDELVRLLRSSQYQVVSVSKAGSKSASRLRVVVTEELFKQLELRIDRAGKLLHAQVFYVDTEQIDRMAVAMIRNGSDADAVARRVIQQVRGIERSAYRPMSEVASPGGSEQDWFALKYVVYHVTRIEEEEVLPEDEAPVEDASSAEESVVGQDREEVAA